MMAMAAMTCAAALVTSCPTAVSCFQDSLNTGQTEKQQRGSLLPVLLEHTAAQGQRGNDHHQQAKDYATNGATKQSRFEGRLGCPECWQDRLRTLTFRTTATKPKRRNRRVTWSNTLPSQAMACITPAESTRRPRGKSHLPGLSSRAMPQQAPRYTPLLPRCSQGPSAQSGATGLSVCTALEPLRTVRRAAPEFNTALRALASAAAQALLSLQRLDAVLHLVAVPPAGAG